MLWVVECVPHRVEDKHLLNAEGRPDMLHDYKSNIHGKEFLGRPLSQQEPKMTNSQVQHVGSDRASLSTEAEEPQA